MLVIVDGIVTPPLIFVDEEKAEEPIEVKPETTTFPNPVPSPIFSITISVVNSPVPLIVTGASRRDSTRRTDTFAAPPTF